MLDVGKYGIHIINVIPAGFRTEFLKASMIKSKLKMTTYDVRCKVFEERNATYRSKQRIIRKNLHTFSMRFHAIQSHLLVFL